MTWSERRGWLPGLAGLALLAAGCDGASSPRGFDLAAAVQSQAGLELPGQPTRATVEVADERREAVLLPNAPWAWRGRVPPRARLSLGAQVWPADPAVTELEIRVEVTAGRDTEVVEVGRARLDRWADLAVDLDRWAGREVTLTVLPEVLGNPATASLAWSPAFLESRSEAAIRQPNVLFILVDTLRADHLTPYGYGRDTSPHIASLLAERGVVAERAYAQAPWTVASAVSYMTGRYPGELLYGPMDGYAIPAETPTLAETFAARGYDTAAFYANYVLRDGNGFGRGFATRWVPPATPDSNFLHADAANARAIPWLRAHQHRPFFLYLHYMDPHDPYDSPELVDGRSPFYPGYRGRFAGGWVHGLYTGRLQLDDQVDDLAHLTALYDSEIHYVDRALGEVLGELAPEVAANTLIVLTSDHGEELYEHGGWKHGQTLYEEQIRVPLIFRWDRRLPAGRRLAGAVELVDLAPTLAAAIGAPPLPEARGMDLLPALAGEQELPRRPVFAQHLASGPLRSALVLAGKKLILFSHADPFSPANWQFEHLWRLDLSRLARRELYDLDADPGEKANQVASRPAVATALEGLTGSYLDRSLRGLRLVASGLGPGQALTVELSLAQEPAGWHAYFLANEDRVHVAGRKVTLRLVGEQAGVGQAEKGLWLEGEGGGVESLVVRTHGGDGEAAPVAVLLGEGTPWRGGPVEAARLLASSRPQAPETGVALRLWTRPAAVAGGAPAIDAEVVESLKALGYLQ
ncbi:MAG TPA: sulfatase [Thermoanaerobaculia bacterium]|nr:sulfatase [Thermoanaerobaculia bacterium]